MRRTLNLCKEPPSRVASPSMSGLRSAGAVAAAGAVMKGANPHAIANIGPDVLCMGAARAAYKPLGASVKERGFCLTRVPIST